MGDWWLGAAGTVLLVVAFLIVLYVLIDWAQQRSRNRGKAPSPAAREALRRQWHEYAVRVDDEDNDPPAPWEKHPGPPVPPPGRRVSGWGYDLGEDDD